MKLFHAALLLLALPAPALAQGFVPWAGEPVALTNAEIPFRYEQYRDSAFYTEEFSFTVQPEKGQPWTLRFGISNLGRAKGTAFVHGSVRRNRKLRYEFEESAKAGTWVMATEPFALTVGKGLVRGGLEGFDVHVENGDVNVDLVIRPLVPAWRPGTGRVEMAPGEGFEVLVWPRCEVLGTLKYKDPKQKKEIFPLKGRAVVTRVLNTVSPALQPRRWIQLRSIKEDHTTLFQAFQPPAVKGDTLHGWTLTTTDSTVLAATHELEVKLGDFREDHGTPIPWIVTWKGTATRGGIQGVKLRRAVDELAKLPALERAVVSRLIQPMTWYLRGKYEVEAGGLKITGPGDYIINKVK